MQTIKGPAVFLAQFYDEKAPFNTLESLAKWASSLGYRAIQIPTWNKALFDLDLAAESKTYCDEITGKLRQYNIQISDLSTHLQGQLVAVHPAYDAAFDTFAPKSHQKNPKKRQEWAVQQVKNAAKAAHHLGLKAVATFSGALLWHMVYPWPQRPKGLVEMGFQELGKRWRPILDVYKNYGIDLCYEVHAGEDLHDGITFEMFLQEVDNHPSANLLYDPSHFILQHLDYLQYIDFYHERIKMFHVKDAEFIRSGKQGVYGGYQDWGQRVGRFRSLGDGQVDFKSIFSKMTYYDYQGWAVLEWECCIKSPEQGAKEGAEFIKSHIIQATDKVFDDFAGGEIDEKTNKQILGLE